MERKPYTREKDNPQDGREYSQITQPTGINLQNVQTAHVAQYQNHHPIKKGRRPKQRFLQRKHTDDQRVQGKNAQHTANI